MIKISFSRPKASFEDFDPGSSNPLEESGWFIRRELRDISDRWSIKPDLPKRAGYVKKEDRTPLYDAWQNVFNRNSFHPEDIMVLRQEGGAVMQRLIEEKHAAIDELTTVCIDNDIKPTNVTKLQGFLNEVANFIEADSVKWHATLSRLLDQMRDNPDLWKGDEHTHWVAA